MSKPHHTYTAREGRIYDETGAEAGTARTADGRDLERFDAALQVARLQREQLEAEAARTTVDELEKQQRRLSVRRLAELEPRPWINYAPRYYDGRGDGYPLEELEPLTIVPTDAGHVHVSTPSGQTFELVSRGRTYNVHPSQHAYRHPDGTWRLEHPDPEQNNSRNGAGRLLGADDAPPTARDHLRLVILAAVQEWTATHADELELADRAALNNAARRREEVIRRTAAELAEQLEQLEQIDAGGPDAPRY